MAGRGAEGTLCKKDNIRLKVMQTIGELYLKSVIL